MWFWLKISICQSSMVHGECWVNCPTRAENLEASTVCWREATRRVQLSRNQAAVDHVRWVAVEDLVLRQEDKPKKHWSSSEISHEIVILYSSVHRKIIHGDLQLTCFKRRHAHCSAVVWSQSYLSSHLLINKLLVCNKSCYCYLLHYKQ